MHIYFALFNKVFRLPFKRHFGNLSIDVKNGLVLSITVLSLSFAGFNKAIANEADIEAHRELVNKHGVFRKMNDKDAMRQLYMKDAMYFQSTGLEAFGDDAVVELLFSRKIPSKKAGLTVEIVTDEIETGVQFGYVYGRVCITVNGEKQNCKVRWFLVTEKGEDGQWRIKADLDSYRKQVIGEN